MTPFEWGFYAAFGAMAAVGAVLGVLVAMVGVADLLVWAFEGVEKRLDKRLWTFPWERKRTVEEALKELDAGDPLDASAIRDRKG